MVSRVVVCLDAAQSEARLSVRANRQEDEGPWLLTDWLCPPPLRLVLSQEPAPRHRARLTVGWTAAHHRAVGLSHSYLGVRPTAPSGPAPAGLCFSRPMPPTMSAAPTPQPSPGLCRRVSESESAAHTSAGSLHPVPSSQDAGAPERAGLPLTHRPGRLVTAMQTSADCKIPLRSHTGAAPTMDCLAAGMAQPRRYAATLLCSFWTQKASPQSC